jgi:DNA-binding transcriptional ArsR family regulator
VGDVVMNDHRVRELAGELRRIVIELDAAAAGPEVRGEVGAPWLRSVLRARRLRGAYFDAALFADPAWEMMLDLLAAQLERRPVDVSSLCLASGVPPTTALRWIRVLTERGIIERRSDARDGRRVFVDLSGSAAARLGACLTDMQAAVPGCL